MRGVALDLGPFDVHRDAPIGRVRRAEMNAVWPGFGAPAATKRTGKPISSTKRSELPDSSFALPTQRKYPIHDASHARNAMARLEQNKDRLSPANYRKAKANILRAYKKFGIKSGASEEGSRGTRASIRTAGLSIHVRHMRDGSIGEPRLAAVEIAPTACGEAVDGEPPKPVWNQLAKIGQWLGHPAGPFRITSKEVGEIIRNFKSQANQKIPIDFEHASEADPTSGTIPAGGAPACGWILELQDRGVDGLWGLVEWSDLAREYITAKPPKYRYFSPAIRFNSKDRVTAQNIGARMTSGALTNTPFLDGMAEMAASDKNHDDTTITMRGLAHKAEEYMPRLRACLSMDDMATARECMERVCRLEELYAKLGNVGVTEGIDLNNFMPKMRDLICAPIGCTWDDVFATTKALIAAASGEFVDDDDEEGAESSRDMRTTTMADNKTIDEMQAKLNSAETLLKDMTDREKGAQDRVQKLTLREAELAKDVLVLSDKVKGLDAQNAELSLKLTDATKNLSDTMAKLTEATTKLAEIQKAEEVRLAKDAETRVDEAIATHGARKGIAAEHKPTMLTLLKLDPAGFEKMYPRVAPAHQHLLREVVTPSAAPQHEQRPGPGGAGGGGADPYEGESLRSLTDRFRKEGLSNEDATIKANGIIRKRDEAKRQDVYRY